MFGRIVPKNSVLGEAALKCKVLVSIKGDSPTFSISQGGAGEPYQLNVHSTITITGICVCEDVCTPNGFEWEKTPNCRTSQGQAGMGSGWTMQICAPAKGDCPCRGSFGPYTMSKRFEFSSNQAGVDLDNPVVQQDPCGALAGRLGGILEGHINNYNDWMVSFLPNGVQIDCNGPLPVA